MLTLKLHIECLVRKACYPKLTLKTNICLTVQNNITKYQTFIVFIKVWLK